MAEAPASVMQLRLYACFHSMETVAKIESTRMLQPSHFNETYTYLPLKSSEEAAVDACIAAMPDNEDTAEHKTVLKMMEISMSADQVLEALKEDRLTNQYVKPDKTWRWSGSLELQKYYVDVRTISVLPLGYARWAECTLSPRFPVKTFNTCEGCKVKGVATWLAKRKDHYCAKCWNTHLAERKRRKLAKKMEEAEKETLKELEEGAKEEA